MSPIIGSIYAKIADLRNALYERGIFRSIALGARTISVGNITAGGTGKTPLVIYIAGLLAERGERVCILTRGYGRTNPRRRVLVSDGNEIFADAKTAGDEPLEMAIRLRGLASVVADADRVAAARWAMREFGVTAFVLDDAFQHRRAKRDVDIVCIDATDPFGAGTMLPDGRLREPMANLKRADMVVITRSNLVDNIGEIRSRIMEIAGNCPIFTASTVSDSLKPLDAVLRSAEKLSIPSVQELAPTSDGSGAFAFCALGNPRAFFEQLSRDGIRVAGMHAFRDHHAYTAHDVKMLSARAREAEAGFLVTTGKDAVKLAGMQFDLPCFVLEMRMAIDDAECFADLI